MVSVSTIQKLEGKLCFYPCRQVQLHFYPPSVFNFVILPLRFQIKAVVCPWDVTPLALTWISDSKKIKENHMAGKKIKIPLLSL
jgi:hypothetical protein